MKEGCSLEGIYTLTDIPSIVPPLWHGMAHSALGPPSPRMPPLPPPHTLYASGR